MTKKVWRILFTCILCAIFLESPSFGASQTGGQRHILLFYEQKYDLLHFDLLLSSDNNAFDFLRIIIHKSINFYQHDQLTIWITVLVFILMLGIIFLLLLNILRRKKAEEKVSSYQERLEELVKERTRELYSVNQNLKNEIIERQEVERLSILSQFAVENASEIIFWINPDSSFHYVNKAACSKYGHTREEFLHKKSGDISLPSDQEEWEGQWQKLKEKKALRFTSQHRTAQGRTIDVEVSMSYLNQDGNEYAFSFVRDITNRKRLEEEYRRNQQLKSLGTLAGGIAHDFNNILTAVFGNIELAAASADQPETTRDFLAKAKEALIRTRQLTQQLLTFSKGGVPAKQIVSSAKLIRNASEFILSGSNIKCTYCFPDTLRLTLVDEEQLKQVFHNLIMNSKEAMPHGGTISISAENFEITEETPLSLHPGHYVLIRICDQGEGISDKHLQRIFEPYFTTKQLGSIKGTGLGLSICHSIIKKHKGLITISSAEHTGTEVQIYLPALQGDLVKELHSPAMAPVAPPKDLLSAKILVMDDEEMVRQIATDLLNFLHFEVTTANNGEEALALYGEAIKNKAPFDLVILDLTIRGGMGGKETLDKLKELDPQVTAIVASGYTEDEILANFQEHGFQAAIPKPFDLSSIKEALAKIIN